MLHLKRVTQRYEFIKCKISGKIMTYGDWYYEDDDDGLIVDAIVYKDMERKQREEDWDYSRIQLAENEREYREKLREMQRKHLQETLLNREVAYNKSRGG